MMLNARRRSLLTPIKMFAGLWGRLRAFREERLVLCRDAFYASDVYCWAHASVVSPKRAVDATETPPR